MTIRKAFVGAVLVLVGLPMVLLATAAAATRLLDKTTGTVVSSGDEREYLLYVPPSYDGTRAVPLVLSLHAAAMWPAQQMNLSRWNVLADVHGFIVAYPSGRGLPKVWPDGLPTGDGRDVAFIGDLIDTIAARYSLDESRIYLTGMSNGAGMATVAACHLSGRIAAVGLVAAVQVVEANSCGEGQPMPMIAFHGDADRMAPYEGGPVGDPFNPAKPMLPAVRDWVATWARRNQCSGSPVHSSVAPDVSRLEYARCARLAAVVLYTLHRAGHTWPGGKPLPRWLAGATSKSVDATSETWAFFRGHSLESR